MSIAQFNSDHWIEVRRGFGEFELSQLAHDECVTDSGVPDGEWIVWRKSTEGEKSAVAAPSDDLAQRAREHRETKMADLGQALYWYDSDVVKFVRAELEAVKQEFTKLRDRAYVVTLDFVIQKIGGRQR